MGRFRALQQHLLDALKDNKAKSARYCCQFVQDVPGADIAPLQACVLEFGTAKHCAQFAREVPSADIKALQTKVLKEGDEVDCYEFARFVPGARIKALQARMLEVGTEWGAIGLRSGHSGCQQEGPDSAIRSLTKRA